MKVKLEDQVAEINKLPSVSAEVVGKAKVRLIFKDFPVMYEHKTRIVDASGRAYRDYVTERAILKDEIAIDLCGGPTHSCLDAGDVGYLSRAVVVRLPAMFFSQGIHPSPFSVAQEEISKRYKRLEAERGYYQAFCINDFPFAVKVRLLLQEENYYEAALQIKNFMGGLVVEMAKNIEPPKKRRA